jgi:hypothetical protein
VLEVALAGGVREVAPPSGVLEVALASCEAEPQDEQEQDGPEGGNG